MRKSISLITLFSFSIQAATITDDKLTVGKKASASAKEIVFDTNDGAANKKLSVDKITKKLSITSDEAIVGDGTASDKALTFNRGGSNAQVKWNEVTDKLQFSNDGTTFKDLGTGGGGGGSTGVNVLTNDSFEDAVGGVLTDWSNTGGTLTQVSYTNSVEGDAKYFQFVATGAGQYFEMSKVVPTNFNGSGCQVDFKKMNIATADLFKVEALDASNNVLATGNVKVSSWQKFPTLSFVCPTAGSTFKIRVTSLAAGTFQGDKAYLGSNQNIVEAACQGTLECEDVFSASINTAGFVDGENLDWINGNCTISDTSLFRCSYTSQLNLIAPMNCVATTATGSLANLSQVSDSKTGYFEVRGGYISNFSGSLTYSPYNFKISCQKQAVDFVKAKPQLAVRNEQSSWFIDANMGGANVGLGTPAMSSYNELQSINLDLVLNTNKGSAVAEIACASGTASTGLTCSSAESFGIAFVPGAGAGLYEVCAAFSQSQADGADIVYQLAETSNTSAVIIQEGGLRQSGNSATGNQLPYYNCGTFNFSDISKRTIRLMYEKTATTANPTIIADRAAGSGQRDIKWTVRPLVSAYNRPILTGDQVTSKGVSNPKIFTASVSSTGVVTNDYSDFINGNCVMGGINNSSATCTFNSGIFTTYSACWAPTPPQMVFAGVANSGSNVNTQVRMQTPGGVDTPTAFQLFCWGF